ncbi:MAG TPA: 1-acyl-sn-glycerol-3-phosphate acyltransferase [Sandaracinaceae bacterium LLY-WYZ-13_1]|nr:1-acyl-sn-glycerol-3-phosphate acyltransferase [Sandaracinaceae bacterium LLY-WYZ-13_1]
MSEPILPVLEAALRATLLARYELRVRHVERVPATGAALLVANHVTYADSLILHSILERRVRFLVDHRIHDQPSLRWVFRMVRAIPIAPRREDPERLRDALREVDRALRAGAMVGVFPEGELTRTGEIGAFRPGVERILARCPVPVVPVALRGLWGSVMSHASGRPFGRLPSVRGRTVEVVFGDPIAPGAATAESLREVVSGMRGARR